MGSLRAPQRAVVGTDLNASFPNENDDAFYSEMAAVSASLSVSLFDAEGTSCGL